MRGNPWKCALERRLWVIVVVILIVRVGRFWVWRGDLVLLVYLVMACPITSLSGITIIKLNLSLRYRHRLQSHRRQTFRRLHSWLLACH